MLHGSQRTTLPLELQPDPAAEQQTPPPVVNTSAGGHDEWSEPERLANDEEGQWTELDIDAPDGTSG